MMKNAIISATIIRLVQDHRRQTVVMAGALVAVLAALLAFGVSERSATAQSEPETVGRVTGLTASAEGQSPGVVRLTWNAADDAQVYFVLYLKEDDFTAGNYGGIQMRAFNGTEGTIDGLAGGTPYRFYATGMRWNFGNFGAVWGAWSEGATATPALGGVPSDAPVVQSEPETVGQVTGLVASVESQQPGTVQLTWNAADDAQVYFVLYLKEDDFTAGNYGGIQMRAFNGTEGTIDGLAGGTSYRFYATGMRWNFGNFGAVWGAWSQGATATPALANISLADLEHGARLEENKPALANQLKALPWVADGVDDSERDSAEKLVEAAIWWPDTFNALLRKSWIQDAITRDEATVIEYIYWITRQYSDEATRLLVSEVVVALLDMPFLDSVESADALAVRSLHRLAVRDTETFLEITSHPKISDGITDEEAKIVVLLWEANERNQASLQTLLDGLDGTGGVYKEERTTNLPHSGEVLLAIIRFHDHRNASMDYLEHAARNVEKFMGEPLGSNYVAWYFGDAVGGHHAGTHITSEPSHDDVNHPYWQDTPAHIAHEVGHYYWTSARGARWISEGGAELVSAISEHERIDRPLEPFRTHCAEFQAIKDIVPTGGLPHASCDYYLGSQLFLGLYHALGEETFRQRFRSLYFKSLSDDPTDDCEGTYLDICHVGAAFKAGASAEVVARVDEVIGRWYYGVGPTSSVSLAELENGEWLEANDPARANRIKALPWVADGVDDSERETAEVLIATAAWDADLFDALLQKPWVLDSVLTADEARVISTMGSSGASTLTDAILEKSWVQDEITRDEATIIENLVWMTGTLWEEGLPDYWSSLVQGAAIEILGMPFLNSVEGADAAAVQVLRLITAFEGGAYFLGIMAHPTLSDGITDDEAKIIGLVNFSLGSLREQIDALLDTSRTVEERTIHLPLSGDVDLAIIRTGPGLEHNMDLLAHSVRNAEEFVEEPIPTQWGKWVGLHFTRIPYANGVNFGRAYIVVDSTCDGLVYDGHWQCTTEDAARIIAHEVAHYYWIGNQGWVDEGAAEFMPVISERARIGAPLEPTGQIGSCADSISELLRLEEESSDCWNGGALGQRLFLDLYHDLGQETFRQGFRNFYLKSQTDDPDDGCEGTELGICHLEAAFKTGAPDDVAAKVDAVIDRWYYGTAPTASVSLDDLERADRMEPAQANQLKALPWIADGIDDSEREAAQMLIDAANHYPDTFSALLQKPWVTDHAETNAIHGIRWAAKSAPAVSKQMLQISWVQDDITEAEGEVIYRLYWTARYAPALAEMMVAKSWVQDDITEAEGEVIYRLYRTAREDPELAGAILDMPFLETFEPDDLMAVSAISRMERRGEDHLEALKQSQIFKDGITDDLTTLVRAAGTIRDADALAQWLVPGYASIEVHTSQTELTPELKISIFRDHGDPDPETMPELVRIAEQLESLMQVPLPNPRLVYVISDQAPPISTNGIGQGANYGFAYGIRGDRENSQRFASEYATDRPMLPSVMIHELGHDYFGNEIKSWLNHTPIKAGFEYIYRLDGRDPSEAPEQVLNVIQRRGCEARNIQHLEEMNPPSSDQTNSLCHHYLGYWMGRELLEAVGQDEFMARMRRLYHLKNKMVSEGADPGIAEIRELFPDQLDIVEHYWSGDVGNPEEQYWGGLANLIGHPMEHFFGCCCAGCMPVDA